MDQALHPASQARLDHVAGAAQVHRLDRPGRIPPHRDARRQVVHDRGASQGTATRLRVGHVTTNHFHGQAVDPGGVLAYQRPHPSPLREQAAHQIAAHMARSACDSHEFFRIALFAHSGR